MAFLHTRIMAILDGQGVVYCLLPHSAPAFTVEAAARTRGVARETMVKSILLRDRTHRFVLACVAGDARVDLQAVRDCLGGTWKRLTFANDEEIEAVTGCPCGAVAPIGMPEDVPVLFDEALTRHERVSISSGDLMLGLELDAANLLRVAHARLARIATRVA